MKTIKHFLDLDEMDPKELKNILAHAKKLKRKKFNPPQLLKGLSLAMMFDKRSTRTRISFELAMKQLGGHTVVMDMANMQITSAESPEHTAKVLSRFVDAVMVRMSDHATLKELASHSTVPFINGLTDHSHPCQVMADMLTIEEKKGKLEGLKVAWFGDFNNVATSFIHAAPIFGFTLVLAVPKPQHPKSTPNKNVSFTDNAAEAAKDADVLVTDTWVSMGQEGKGVEMFKPFQVNASLMAVAKPDAIFMHCMPIHRGEEVTEEVLASPASVIFDEAENRLHAQKAILAWCLKGSGVRVSILN
jgi:ornithine carbamoyltransferase